MTAEEVLLEVAERLPPEATLYEAITELTFRDRVLDGLAELDQGECLTPNEARAEIEQWTTKY